MVAVIDIEQLRFITESPQKKNLTIQVSLKISGIGLRKLEVSPIIPLGVVPFQSGLIGKTCIGAYVIRTAQTDVM